MEETSYFKRSWRVLGRNPNWWKTITVLALVMLVPIIGPITVLGYCFRWGREAAWGVEEPLPTNSDGVKAAIKSGWIVFLVMFVWGIVFSAVYSLLVIIPAVGTFLGVLGILAGIAVDMVVGVMAMRGVIYERVAPAFQLRQAWNMCRNEPNGLVRILCIKILFIVATMLVVACCAMLFSAIPGSDFYEYLTKYSPSVRHAMRSSSYGFISYKPLIVALMVLLAYVALCIQVIGDAIVARSFGYWTAQFEPGKWGGSQDGVPAGVGPQGVAERMRRKAERNQKAYAPQQVQQPGPMHPGQQPYPGGMQQPYVSVGQQPVQGQQPFTEPNPAQVPYQGVGQQPVQTPGQTYQPQTTYQPHGASGSSQERHQTSVEQPATQADDAGAGRPEQQGKPSEAQAGEQGEIADDSYLRTQGPIPGAAENAGDSSSSES